jgi:hypothetical protein
MPRYLLPASSGKWIGWVCVRHPSPYSHEHNENINPTLLTSETSEKFPSSTRCWRPKRRMHINTEQRRNLKISNYVHLKSLWFFALSITSFFIKHDTVLLITEEFRVSAIHCFAASRGEWFQCADIGFLCVRIIMFAYGEITVNADYNYVPPSLFLSL